MSFNGRTAEEGRRAIWAFCWATLGSQDEFNDVNGLAERLAAHIISFAMPLGMT
jgi:hypothetical protein